MRLLYVVVALAAMSVPTSADEAISDEEAAKQAENPIADIVNVKLQNNTNYLIGPNERTQDALILQPIIPVHLPRRLSLIAIANIPWVWQPDVANPTGTTFGMADIVMNFYFGLRPRSIWYWGVGPSLRLPTGTDRRLGPFDSGEFSLGATAAFAVTPGHWVLGAFVSNVWSVGGRDGGATVNQLVVQPIASFNFPSAWYLTYSPNIVGDWTAPTANGWLVPVGGGVGKVKLIRRAAFGFEVQAFWNVVRPEPGPLWTLRLQISLAFPKPRPPRPPGP